MIGSIFMLFYFLDPQLAWKIYIALIIKEAKKRFPDMQDGIFSMCKVNFSGKVSQMKNGHFRI